MYWSYLDIWLDGSRLGLGDDARSCRLSVAGVWNMFWSDLSSLQTVRLFKDSALPVTRSSELRCAVGLARRQHSSEHPACPCSLSVFISCQQPCMNVGKSLRRASSRFLLNKPSLSQGLVCIDCTDRTTAQS